jgi:hypothetical protein
MNRLFYGDNLSALRESIADEFCWSVDLIYLDPGLGRMVTDGRFARATGQRCDGLHGWKRALARIVERSHPDCRKPVRRSFRFNRVTGL